MDTYRTTNSVNAMLNDDHFLTIASQKDTLVASAKSKRFALGIFPGQRQNPKVPHFK
jgi:hypothetical protein